MDNISNEKPADYFIKKWQSLGRVFEEYAKSKGLTYMSFIVLQTIYKYPDCCTQKLICEQSLYTKQSVNAIIKNFWKQGYVELREEAADRRNKKIIFTEKGQVYADEIIGKFLAIEKEAMEHLSSAQWEQLIGMVELFAEHFAEGMTRLIQASEKNNSGR